MIRRLVTLFIYFSFVTQTFSESGTNPVLSRLTFSDLFGILALVFGLKYLSNGLREVISISKIYSAAFFMVFLFFMSSLYSFQITSSLIETSIILFLILISLIIFESFKDNFLDKFIPLIIYVAISASIIGIYDYVAEITGLPKIFPSRASGEVLSGFRNAGQAGAYFLIIITILFPLRFSGLYYFLSVRNRKLLNIALFLSILFLFFTGKIAVYIGFVIGLFIYAIIQRNMKTIIGIFLMILLGSFIYVNIETIAPELYSRITSKVHTRIINRIQGDQDDNNFISSNWGEAIRAFEDRPITGTGLGAFTNNYKSEYEVHSTYLKMLGETGIIGSFGYLIFIIMFISLFKLRKLKDVNPFADYLHKMFPFIIGCLVSWSYTYHLRKREFWILFVVVLIVNYIIYNYKVNRKDNLEY